MHVFCFILIALASAVVFFTDNIGVSIVGVCSFKLVKNATYINVSITFGYLLTLVASSSVFLKYLRKVSQTDTRTRQFFRYYFKYLIIISINYLVQGISYVAIAVICDQQTNQDLFNAFTTVVNVTVIVTPMFVTLVTLGHPEMRKILCLRLLQTWA